MIIILVFGNIQSAYCRPVFITTEMEMVATQMLTATGIASEESAVSLVAAQMCKKAGITAAEVITEVAIADAPAALQLPSWAMRIYSWDWLTMSKVAPFFLGLGEGLACYVMGNYPVVNVTTELIGSYLDSVKNSSCSSNLQPRVNNVINFINNHGPGTSNEGNIYCLVQRDSSPSFRAYTKFYCTDGYISVSGKYLIFENCTWLHCLEFNNIDHPLSMIVESDQTHYLELDLYPYKVAPYEVVNVPLTRTYNDPGINHNRNVVGNPQPGQTIWVIEHVGPDGRPDAVTVTSTHTDGDGNVIVDVLPGDPGYPPPAPDQDPQPVQDPVKPYYPSPPGTGVLDLDPLRRLGSAITTRFPFSLPWDIYRGLDVVRGQGSLQPLHLQFYMPLSDTPYEFDVVWPDFVITLAPYVRAGFLLIFTIGLVMSTRKLLGGAS